MIMTRGARHCRFSSLRSRRWAAAACTVAAWRPACRAGSASGCPAPPRSGRLRRIWLANTWPNFSPSVDHSTGCASGTFGQLRPLPPVDPLCGSTVADDDAPRSQQRVHPAQAQGKTEVEPNGVADDLSREAVAGVAGSSGRCHPARLPASAASRKPTSSQVDGALPCPRYVRT